MIFVTRKTHFSAAHRLYNPTFSDERNEDVFDKCNNFWGHGHNYVLEVTVKGLPDPGTGYVIDLKKLKALLEEVIINKVDHRHLNFDVDFLQGVIPTVENLCVAFWQQLDAWQTRLAAQLMTGNELHFHTPAGTDLTVNISGARWLSSPGRKNFPDGEVYSGPNLHADNGGVDGVVVFDKRCVYQGHAVRNARIVMKQGRATDITADEGQDFLIAMLTQDEGACRIGEVAFGTNRAITQPTGQILYDEKMGGSFHLAFGSGYPETGNCNKSALHWDLIASLTTGSSVTLDTKPFCIDGQFVTMPPEVNWL